MSSRIVPLVVLVSLLTTSSVYAQDLFVRVQAGISGWQASQGLKASYPRSPLGFGVDVAIRRGAFGMVLGFYDPKRSDMGTEDGSYLNPAYLHLGALVYPAKFFHLGGGLSLMRYTERINDLLRRGDESGFHTSTNLGYFLTVGDDVPTVGGFTVGAGFRYDLHFGLNSSFPLTANQSAHTSTVELVIGRHFSL